MKNNFNMLSDRDMELLCTLRGSNSDPVRLRVRQWVAEYAKARGIKKYSTGQVDYYSFMLVM